MTFDCVAFGAHPDDCELFAGGFLAKAIAGGARIGIVHLCRGERGTRGSVEERRSEARDAAQALGLAEDQLEILDLGDTLLENNESNRFEIIRILRRWRPNLVLSHHPEDRHPDHRKASQLVGDAFFYSGLRKIDTGHEPWRAAMRLEFYNNSAPERQPSLIVDVSDSFSRKMDAIRCYKSQIYNPQYQGEQTYISSPEYLEQIEIRARYFGAQIGARYGEPFHAVSPLCVQDPLSLMR